MATIRSAADYESCLLEILRAAGGRASRGHVVREFERRFSTNLPADQWQPVATAPGRPPRWQYAIDAAARHLRTRGALSGPEPDIWDLT